MDQKIRRPESGLHSKEITRRQFAAASGMALIGGLIGAPGRLSGSTSALSQTGGTHSGRPETGTFDLHITFSGLCLFTLDTQNKQRFTVMLMKNAEHAHVARLVYDKAYASRGTHELSGDLEYKRLEGSALTIDHKQHSISTERLPQEIVDLDRIARTGKLARKYAEGKADADVHEHIAARFTTNVGALSGLTLGSVFRVNEGAAAGWEGEITTCVTWTIRGIQSDSLSHWRLLGLNDGSDNKKLQTLYPIGGAIRVFIYNVPPEELSGVLSGEMSPSTSKRPVQNGDAAEHFAVYYRPFGITPVIPVIGTLREPVFCGPSPGMLENSDCQGSQHLTASERHRTHRSVLRREPLPAASVITAAYRAVPESSNELNCNGVSGLPILTPDRPHCVGAQVALAEY